MGPGMMTRKSKLLFLTVLIFSSCMFSVFAAAASQANWVIAAQKFSFTRNQSDSVAEGIAVMFPSRILEKLSANLYRPIFEDEKAERELYKLKQERNSLFLQLSNEVKKRDSLVLGKYKQSELNRKIEEQNKKIDDIKAKLKLNLEQQHELETLIQNQNEEALKKLSADNQETVKTGAFLKNLFVNRTTQTDEKIKLYNNDITALYSSSADEKDVVGAGINCLLTGSITAFDEYMSVTVRAVIYPGAKEAACITEIGSVDEADFLASNIVRQLAPVITNSMPSEIKINLLTADAAQSFNVYIDDILYKNTDEAFTIDSGVHFIQFTAQGYRNAGTSYYFEGNKTYQINVELEEIETKTIFVRPLKPVEGDFFVNGLNTTKLTDGASKIEINGNAVLGQFITESKTTAYFYIPQKKLVDETLYVSKLKPLDHSDYIEKRRREMYLSYSIFVTSLVPTVIASGVVKSYKTVLADTANQKNIDNLDKKIDTANKWILASNISSGISIACGVWLIYELYRYFTAANSVLPVSTRVELDYSEAPPLKLEIEETEAEGETEAVSEGEAPLQTETVID